MYITYKFIGWLLPSMDGWRERERDDMNIKLNFLDEQHVHACKIIERNKDKHCS